MKEASHTVQISLAPDVLLRKVGDEAVLLHLGSERYFSLNDSAARMWELLAEGKDPAAVAQALSEEYEADVARLQADVEDLVRQLGESGLVTVSGA